MAKALFSKETQQLCKFIVKNVFHQRNTHQTKQTDYKYKGTDKAQW